MLRLIALYLHYRDVQDERSRGIAHVAAPTSRDLPRSAANADDKEAVRALAA